MKRLPLLLILLLPLNACRAAFTEFYVDLVGGLTNSGHTASTTPIVAKQNGNWDSTTGIYICNGATDLSGVSVGDWASVYIDGATVAVFVGRITGVDDGTDTITVSLVYKMGAAPSTSAVLRSITIGGCWPFPNGTATDFPFNFFASSAINTASNPPCLNIKSNLYPVTGQLDFTGVGGICEGYLTTPHDGGRPIISSAVGASFVMVSASSGNWAQIKNLEFDANFTSGTSIGINTGLRDVLIGVVVRDSRGAAFQVSNEGVAFIGCEAINSLSSGFAATAETVFYQCISHNNAVNGFFLGGATMQTINCIAYSNSGSGFHFAGTATLQAAIGCDAYGNSTNGFALTTDNPYALINCNALGNSQYGVASLSPTAAITVNLFNCGFGSGSQTNTFGSMTETVGHLNAIGTITYPANTTPWKNPNAGNFSISLPQARGVGYNGFLQKDVTVSTNKTVGYFDIGAAQSPSTNSSGGGSFTFSQ